MASPIGHTLIGLVIARRLGVRSPLGMVAAAVGASLPDADMIAGMALHGDPWKLHRKATHTPGFALSAGMLAGFAGLVSAGNAEGERDLIADAFTGAAIVGPPHWFEPELDRQMRARRSLSRRPLTSLHSAGVHTGSTRSSADRRAASLCDICIVRMKGLCRVEALRDARSGVYLPSVCRSSFAVSMVHP